jgi:hypothetical protein
MNLSKLPKELRPTGIAEEVKLQKCNPVFKAWKGPTGFSFGNKRFLEYKKQPVFAEILILRLLESAGWNGVWVEPFGGFKFLREMPKDAKLGGVEIPAMQNAFLLSLKKAVGKGGIFDVFAWRDGEFIFCESKEKGKDKFQDTQTRWIKSVLELGISRENLLIVEWSFLP